MPAFERLIRSRVQSLSIVSPSFICSGHNQCSTNSGERPWQCANVWLIRGFGEQTQRDALQYRLVWPGIAKWHLPARMIGKGTVSLDFTQGLSAMSSETGEYNNVAD